jgi:ElaB/YqjD/DUF883 family membrane-anchored ribosome-binding protein
MAEHTDEVEEIKEAAESRVEQARAVVSEKIGAAREKLSGVSSAAGKKLQEVKEHAGETTQAVRERAAEGLKQGYARVRKDLDDLSSDVNAYVKDNPGRSVLIAVAVGFVLGMLIRRDRS